MEEVEGYFEHFGLFISVMRTGEESGRDGYFCFLGNQLLG